MPERKLGREAVEPGIERVSAMRVLSSPSLAAIQTLLSHLATPIDHRTPAIRLQSNHL